MSVELPELNLDFVRSQFPAFDQPSLDGWAFFENAGGSYSSRQTCLLYTSPSPRD